MAEDARTTGRAAPGGGAEPGLGELVKQLANDTTTLVRQEVSLAKLELGQATKKVGKGVAFLAVGGSLVLVGLLTLVAFLVMVLADMFDDKPWLGALIVGLFFVGVGAMVALSARKELYASSLAPTETLNTLRDDKQWAQNEAKQVRRDLTR